MFVTMWVFERRGRWPGAGGVYGGCPVSRVGVRRRYESVRVSREGGSYWRVAKGGYSDEGVCRLVVLAGVAALILGVGAFALCVQPPLGGLFSCCACWSPLVLPCFMLLGVWGVPGRWDVVGRVVGLCCCLLPGASPVLAYNGGVRGLSSLPGRVLGLLS